MEIKEEGLRKKLLENHNNTELGQMLRDVNVEGYLYTNRTGNLGKKKKTSSLIN